MTPPPTTTTPTPTSHAPPDLPPPTLPFITSPLPASTTLTTLSVPPRRAAVPTKRTRLTDFEKGQIAALWCEHKSIRHVQRRLQEWGQRRPYNTIKSFVDRWTERGKDYGNVRASGRPVKVVVEERRRIRAEVARRRKEGKISWEVLQREVAPGVSLRTLKRIVRGEYADDGAVEEVGEGEGEGGEVGRSESEEEQGRDEGMEVDGEGGDGFS